MPKPSSIQAASGTEKRIALKYKLIEITLGLGLDEVAPVLELDDPPYVVMVDGRIYRIQDIYITAGSYPYSGWPASG